MKYGNSFSLLLAALSSAVNASPIIDFSNGTLLETRATPTTMTADILSNMKLFAQYAAAAYCNADTTLIGKAIMCSNSVCDSVSATNYAYLGYNQAEASGYIGIDKSRKLIVVAYAGSANFDNYVADILFEMASCDGNLVSGCKFHTGFQYAWGDVTATTMSALKAAVAAYPSYKVVLTGHSLGGAVATIGAAYIRAAGIPCDVYSYGSPRVGNGAFVDFMDAQAGAHYRVTHTDDPIPRYPGKLFGFRHTSPEFWLSTGGDTTVSYALGDIKVCEGTSNTKCNDGTGSLGLTPHSYYFGHISACA